MKTSQDSQTQVGSIGRTIRELRLERGMTLDQLELAAGITSGNLSRVERGTQGITEDLIYRLSEALNIHPSTLFMRGVGKLPATPDQQQWLDLIAKLFAHQKNELFAQLTDTARKNDLVREELSGLVRKKRKA